MKHGYINYNNAKLKLARVRWGHLIDGIIATEETKDGTLISYHPMEFEFAEYIINLHKNQ